MAKVSCVLPTHLKMQLGLGPFLIVPNALKIIWTPLQHAQYLTRMNLVTKQYIASKHFIMNKKHESFERLSKKLGHFICHIRSFRNIMRKIWNTLSPDTVAGITRD